MSEALIADDHAVFLDALSAVLSSEGWAVIKATTVEDAVAAVSERQPEVCLIDRHFAAGRDGLGAVRDLIAVAPRTKVVILSGDGNTDSIMQAMSAGAAGYVHKTRSVAVLKRTIERVLRGEVVVEVPAGPAIQPQLARQRDALRLVRCLTVRERQCLELLVAGQDTAAMVRSLGVSAATVRTHVQALLTKLGAHSRLEAAAFAVRHGLLDDRVGRDLAGGYARLARTVLAERPAAQV
ncbi:MAG TPA: response regulator transcription factor [Streptosporangiaceae bacterium]|nr:response regulator transcription factor [Streptosporangiaceae bacterium]